MSIYGNTIQTPKCQAVTSGGHGNEKDSQTSTVGDFAQGSASL